MSKKKKERLAAEAEELIRKESTENSIPIESGDWVTNLKNGDLLYSAGYEKDKDGKEQVVTLTLKFIEYDKKAIPTPSVLMAKLVPVVDGKVPEGITIPNQNIRTGFFRTKLEAIRAFEKAISHMADVIKDTGDKLEAEGNKVVVPVSQNETKENEEEKKND